MNKSKYSVMIGKIYSILCTTFNYIFANSCDLVNDLS